MKRVRGNRRLGSAVVELALVTPVLVVLSLGVVDFARVLNDAIALASAAHAGAEYGAQSLTRTSETSGIIAATRNDAPALKTRMTVTTSRACKCTDGASVACVPTGISSGCADGRNPGVYVTVVARCNFATLTTYPGIPKTVNLGSTAVVRAQ